MKTNIKNPFVYFYVFAWRYFLVSVGKKFAVGGVKLPEVKTAKGLSLWYIKKGIQYKSDTIDGIKHWTTFIQDGGGDCDDFAEFAFLVLCRSGYYCKRLYLQGSGGSHVVVLCEKKGSFEIMDCNACFSDIKSEEEACKYYEQDGFNKYLLL